MILPLNHQHALFSKTRVIILEEVSSTCRPFQRGVILKHWRAGTLNSRGIMCVNGIVYMLLALVKDFSKIG